MNDLSKALLVLGLVTVSAWLKINRKDGSSWAFLAILVLLLA